MFLTSEGALAAAEPEVWRGAVGQVAVLSDGLQMVALQMPSREPHPGFFTPLFRYLETQRDGLQASEAVAAFLGSARVRERTDDDITLILASLVAEAL
jgi:hypothetical protein